MIDWISNKKNWQPALDADGNERENVYHFQVSGRRGITCGRPDPEVDPFGDPPVDETIMQVSDILPAKGLGHLHL